MLEQLTNQAHIQELRRKAQEHQAKLEHLKRSKTNRSNKNKPG